MKKIFIIPDITEREETSKLAQMYSLGYEYNDFYVPEILDDENRKQEICEAYQMSYVPEFATLHGAFFDIVPFSLDEKIREISALRIEQSIQIAKKIGASAVIFHTNYNPFLNSDVYIKNWVEQNTCFWSDVLDQNTDINIYLENMFDFSPDILRKLSERLYKYKNYGVCFDFAHAVLSKTNPKIWAEQLGKYVKHIHINDNDLVSDLHLAWGEGKINRQMFYECYDKYMDGASVLIETSSLKRKQSSLETLKAEGFI